MTTPINLNKFRKAKNRAEEKRQADENAVKFGMSKAERLLAATRNEKVKRALDRHQLDPDNELED